MKVCKQLCLAALMTLGAISYGQPIPPVDHVFINDSRVFDISDDGSTYELIDGPVAAAVLSIVHGPNGMLAASINVQDDHMNTWGPITLTGKLSLKGTNPLKLKLAGGGAGAAKVQIIGSYDAPLKLMRVLVKVKTPEGLKFQWNDAFVPDFAGLTGLSIDRVSVATNLNGIIKGQHAVSATSHMGLVNSLDQEKPNSDFRLKGKGFNVMGDYNPGPATFSVWSSKASLGYGTFFTPGSLVTVTSDNLFLRN